MKTFFNLNFCEKMFIRFHNIVKIDPFIYTLHPIHYIQLNMLLNGSTDIYGRFSIRSRIYGSLVIPK